MSIHASLSALGDLLRERTRRTVSISLPEPGSTAIHLWPWMVQERQAVGRQSASRLGDDGRRTGRPYAPHVHTLVLVRPDMGADAIALLDQIAQAVHDTPVVNIDHKSFGLSWDVLEPATLAAIFQSASVRLSACLGVVIAPQTVMPETRPGAGGLQDPAELLGAM